MTAAEMAHRMGGRHSGGGTYMARCPAHDDNEPSLAIADGEAGAVLVRCHAGCEQAAVLEALRNMGLWGNVERPAPDFERIEAERAARRIQDRQRIETARGIWEGARPGGRTHVERYLRSRGISLEVPERLRFSVLKHRSGGRWPVMVGLVTDAADRVIGAHRTYIASDGRGKAPVAPVKMCLGPIASGAVRLAPVAPELLIAEGIETALSASELAGIGAWAALSASGLERLELPDAVRSVVIAADRDPNETGQRAARAAAERWQSEGRSVRVELPAAPHKDFNDMLVALPARRSKVA